tara:strand:+ start:58927 stop:59049 length:123 start_codon:yes stop_codon:yes gene_type:complete
MRDLATPFDAVIDVSCFALDLSVILHIILIILWPNPLNLI